MVMYRLRIFNIGTIFNHVGLEKINMPLSIVVVKEDMLY